MTSSIPERTGAKASEATDFTPEAMRWNPPRASSVMMVTEASTNKSNVVRGRRDRRGIGRSARRRGDEDLLEGLELLEALPTAYGDAVEGIAGHHDGHTGLLGEA